MQVWAFGDMPNDLPMLRWAGASFAVANAHPDVHSQADSSLPEPTTRTASRIVVEALLAR
jgi:hydroxymethylpyrimidine pyrophosphatase-like HAD family hydrolase